MGDLLQLRPRRRELTYRELALEVGMSRRWLIYRYREGMPDSGLNWKGERVFDPNETHPWLKDWFAKRGRVWSPVSESTHHGEAV